MLVDEVLTPGMKLAARMRLPLTRTTDSSRLWSASSYRVGQSQDSFDKQHVRDWLTRANLKGKEGVELPEEVVKATQQKYKDVFEHLVGRRWADVLGTVKSEAVLNQ